LNIFKHPLRGRAISTTIDSRAPQWVQTANKTIIAFGKVSLILSAAVSRPGAFIASAVMNRVFRQVELEYLFGPNTIFAINPSHPHHVISIASVVFAMPTVVQSIYLVSSWTCRKICQSKKEPYLGTDQGWLTDAKVRLMILFNTVTSRPFLHAGNQWMRLCISFTRYPL